MAKYCHNWLGQLPGDQGKMEIDKLHDIELVKPVAVGTPFGAPASSGTAHPSLMERIPFDVLFLICRNLEYPDALALSRTNRALRMFVRPEVVVSADKRRRFYLKAEKLCELSRNEGLLVCFSCNRLRPRCRFGDTQATGPRGKWGSHPEMAMSRFCWDCASTKRLYREGQPNRKDGHLWYLCHACGVFKLKSQRCVKERYRVGDDAKDADFHERTICTPAWPVSLPSPLERQLPLRLQERIIGNLGYRDRIALAATNRHFRRIARPLDAPLHDKATVVKNVSIAAAQAGARTMACHGCFRVLPEVKFPVLQRSDSWRWWQRRCGACCLFMARGDSEESLAARAHWLSLAECWFCVLVKYRGKKCLSCNEEGPRWDRARAVQAERAGRRRLNETAAEQDLSDFFGSAGDEATESELSTTDNQRVATATASVETHQEGKAAQEDAGVSSKVKTTLEGGRKAGVKLAFTGGNGSFYERIYHRLQRHATNAHALRNRQALPHLVPWGVFGQRLRKVLRER